MKKIIFPAIIVLILVVTAAHGQEPVEQMGLSDCVRLNMEEAKIIDTSDQLLSLIRNDASRDRCLEKITDLGIDLYSNTLVGVSINSGYCRRPPGLKYELETDHTIPTATLKIRYAEPRHGGCAALSRYDLWLLIPKPPSGISIKVNVGADSGIESGDNLWDL
ncbi:MAG: hypothetical protein KF685_12250 [Acidobacteria bacterium]|nr:hypothetical protein [Acidobacteriota bacterium]